MDSGTDRVASQLRMQRRRSKQRVIPRVAEVVIDSIGARGDGIAHLEGRPLYVPFSQAGDRLRVRLEAPRGEGLAARIVEVLAPGAGRVAPPCPQFGECGGCALQHIADGLYAEWKVAQLRTALARRGLAELPLQPLVRVPPGTRRRAAMVAERTGGSVRLGFHARASHRVVDATGCLVLSPALMQLLPRLRDVLPSLLSEGERIDITATAAETGVDLLLSGRRPPALAQREALARLATGAALARVTWLAAGTPGEPIVLHRAAQMTFAGIRVDLPSGAFLQPTAEGESALVRAVVEAMRECRRVADLYSGVGTFTFPLARNASVHAVEGDADAAGALAAAGRRAMLGARVTAEQRDLAHDPLTVEELTRFDGVVFDPPRAGAKTQSEILARSSVAAVVAVSCDPATFARDARILVDGGYRMLSVTPIDQFLWSPHLEAVAVFQR